MPVQCYLSEQVDNISLYTMHDSRRPEKRSTLFMRRVAEGELLGVRLYKLHTDPIDSDFRESGSMGDDYVSKQEKYWASRLIRC